MQHAILDMGDGMAKVRVLAAVMALGIGSALNHAQARNSKDLTVQSAIETKPFEIALIASPGDSLKIGSTIELQLDSSIMGFAHLYVLSASGKVQLWLEN